MHRPENVHSPELRKICGVVWAIYPRFGGTARKESSVKPYLVDFDG
jgi:hypothetical protein